MVKTRLVFCILFAFIVISLLEGSSYAKAQVSFGIDTQSQIADPIYIENSADFAKYALKGDGSANSPYIIGNLAISGGPNISCIVINQTNLHFIIRNCILENSTEFGFGIRLVEAQNGRIESCTIQNCKAGIAMYDCRSVEISKCEFVDNPTGVTISYSVLCTFSNNWFINTLSIRGGAMNIYECANIVFEGNRILGGFWSGIWSNYGISIVMANNTIAFNDFGIQIWGCSNWQIYGNSFIQNIHNAMAGYGSINYWNTTNLGNYWLDLESEDSYYIDANNIDNNPSGISIAQPVTGTAPYIELVEGDRGVFVEWSVYDPYPVSYSIQDSTGVIEEGFWDGFGIILPIEGLPAGIYNYTLTVTNIFGFIRDIEATVVVIAPVPQPIFFLPFLILSPTLLFIARIIKIPGKIKIERVNRDNLAWSLVAISMIMLALSGVIFYLESGKWDQWIEINSQYVLWISLLASSITIVSFRLDKDYGSNRAAHLATLPEEVTKFLLNAERRISNSVKALYESIVPSSISSSNFVGSIQISDQSLTVNDYEEMRRIVFDLSQDARELHFAYEGFVQKLPKIPQKDEVNKIAQRAKKLRKHSEIIKKYPLLQIYLWDFINDQQKLFIVGLVNKQFGGDEKQWPLEKIYFRDLSLERDIPFGWSKRAAYLRNWERGVAELSDNLLRASRGIGALLPSQSEKELQIMIEGEGIDSSFRRRISEPINGGMTTEVEYHSILVRNSENSSAQNCIAKITVWDSNSRMIVNSQRLGWKNRGKDDAVNPITIGARSSELLNYLYVRDSIRLLTTEKLYQGYPIRLPSDDYRIQIEVVADGFRSTMRIFTLRIEDEVIILRESQDQDSLEKDEQKIE